MKYRVLYSSEAEKDIKKLRLSGDKGVVQKLSKLIEELKVHPYEGTGQVEQLKYFANRNVWSRRITKKHRLVYEVFDKEIVVLLLSVLGHYQDK